MNEEILFQQWFRTSLSELYDENKQPKPKQGDSPLNINNMILDRTSTFEKDISDEDNETNTNSVSKENVIIYPVNVGNSLNFLFSSSVDEISSFESPENMGRSSFLILGNFPQLERRREKYVCTYSDCQMDFRHKWLLDKHLESHSTFHFFKCPEEGCNKSYKSKENLILHITNVHKREKPFKCKHCHMKFSHRNGRTYHERKAHTKILPHACTVVNCTRRFASKSALAYHMNFQHRLI